MRFGFLPVAFDVLSESETVALEEVFGERNSHPLEVLVGFPCLRHLNLMLVSGVTHIISLDSLLDLLHLPLLG